MTYIPGTGVIAVPKTEPKKVVNQPKNELLTVVNVKELKNPEKKEVSHEPEQWYFQLKYWMVFGGIFSAICAIASIINFRFLFLTPLGPYVAYLTWHARKKFKSISKNIDALS